jgi:hypothetical protein
MKQLKHDTAGYMELSVEVHEAFQRIKPYTVDYRLMQTASNQQHSDILASIEAMTNQAASFSKFTKDVVEYASSLQQSALRYLDVIAKQCKLSQESIAPLLKATEVFEALYGKEKLDKLVSTNVNYFDRKSKKDYPLAILEQLADIVLKCQDDDIKFTCVKLLKCKYKEEQLEYPRIKDLLNRRAASLEALGHSIDAFNHELTYLSCGASDYGTPACVKLIQDKNQVISTINNKHTEISDMVKKINSKSFTVEDIQRVMKAASNLQAYTVALSSIMLLLQAASYTAYEAGYALHTAEISYNN